MSNKVSPEMAKEELIALLTEMDIDTNVDDMLEEDRKDFEGLLQSLINPIVNGKAHIDGGSYIFKLKKPVGKDEHQITEVTISEPTGAAWELIDRTKNGEDIKKMMRFAEGFTGVHYAQICKMMNADVKILRVFSQLFLA